MSSDVIITGLPRSGLTVVSALADSLPNCVSINAPRSHLSQAGFYPSAQEYCKWLIGDFSWTRLQLLKQTRFADYRASDGHALLDNTHDPRQPKENGEPALVWFTREGLDAKLTLSIKHHAAYTAALPQLVASEHFRIIAVIRHPYDVIGSWLRQAGEHFTEGRIPKRVEQFWPEAAQIAANESDPIARMVQLYECYIKRYHELSEHIHIVKFEDVTADPMLVARWLFSDHTPAAAKLLRPSPRLIDRDMADTLRQHFRRHGVYTRQFYDL